MFAVRGEVNSTGMDQPLEDLMIYIRS